LLPFRSPCSTKNIGFNDSGYVIKALQPSSAIYGAPPFTGNQFWPSLTHLAFLENQKKADNIWLFLIFFQS